MNNRRPSSPPPNRTPRGSQYKYAKKKRAAARRRKNSAVLIILACLLVAVIAGSIIFAAMHSSKKNPSDIQNDSGSSDSYRDSNDSTSSDEPDSSDTSSDTDDTSDTVGDTSQNPPDTTGTVDVSSIKVPSDIKRTYFEDCGKKADGTPDGSWFPGKVVRNLQTGEVTYKWDRYQSTLDALKKYGAIYRKNEDKKVVYLTFDSGYELGYTGAVLDVLKEKNVKSIFFLTGDYVENESNRQYIERMINEGHLIGNHTYSHPTMSEESDSAFIDQLQKVEKALKNTVGDRMTMRYYRPPTGAVTERDMYLAKELGYTVTLWSVAHADYSADNQPDPAKALEYLKSWLHDGSVYLLHSVSKTNSEILGDLIDYIRAEGYEIRRIDQ